MKVRIEDLLTGGSETIEFNCKGKIIGKSESRADVLLPIISDTPYLQKKIREAIIENQIGYVSSLHCTIREENGQLYLKDHSTNGTRLPKRNQILIKYQEVKISLGECISLARVYPIMIMSHNDTNDLNENPENQRGD